MRDIFLAWIAGAAMANCGTDASGIDVCRSIEQARCQRALACPALGITTDTGVEECSQFARDRCLHGTAVADPGSAAVDSCVKAISSDATCAVVADPLASPACAFLAGSLSTFDASTDAGAATGATVDSSGSAAE